ERVDRGGGERRVGGTRADDHWRPRAQLAERVEHGDAIHSPALLTAPRIRGVSRGLTPRIASHSKAPGGTPHTCCEPQAHSRYCNHSYLDIDSNMTWCGTRMPTGSRWPSTVRCASTTTVRIWLTSSSTWYGMPSAPRTGSATSRVAAWEKYRSPSTLLWLATRSMGVRCTSPRARMSAEKPMPDPSMSTTGFLPTRWAPIAMAMPSSSREHWYAAIS